MSYKRKQQDNRRLHKLYAATRNSCCTGAYYDKRKDRLIRYSKTDNHGTRSSYLRRRSNKKIRSEPLHEDSHAYQGGEYRRCYDYWWELY